MKRKNLVIISALIIAAMVSVPMVYGAAASSAFIGSNWVFLNESSDGGVTVTVGGDSETPVVVPAGDEDGHESFQVQANQNEENLIVGGGENIPFSVEIPAGVHFCLKIEAGKIIISQSSVTISVDGTDYVATVVDGTFYYSPANVHTDGVTMLPLGNINQVTFFATDEPIIINGVASRPSIIPGIFGYPTLKMYVIYQ